MKWKLVHNFRPNGHAYFEDGLGRIAIADCSGRTPDETEDGRLYVTNPIEMTMHHAKEPGRSTTFVLHLVKDEGTLTSRTSTPISYEEAQFILRFGGDCPLCGHWEPHPHLRKIRQEGMKT